MFSVCVIGVIVIFLGFIKICFDKILICLGIVVENSIVWCFLGVLLIMFVIFLIKFIFNIWFVLLSIRYFIFCNDIIFWFIKLSNWFGVVIIIFILCFSVFFCFFCDILL